MKYNFYFLLLLLNFFANTCLIGADNPGGIFETFKKCGQVIMQNSGKIAESVKEHGGKFAGVGDKLGKVFSDMAAAATAITIARFGKDIVVEVKERVSPGHDRQLKLATQEMNKCLFEFKAESKDQFNLPIACRNHLDKYERLAGPIALNAVRKAVANN